jgi:hypothetical protein
MPKKKAEPARRSAAASRAPAKRSIARRPTGFDIKRFYQQLEIPPVEQKLVAHCLERGLKSYYNCVYGAAKKAPAGGLRERMHQPYVFGFGVVEVVREAALSPETRLKAVGHALDQIDVEAEYGTPHGLPAMLSFLARADRLEPVLFRSVMIAADFEGALFEDWLFDEVHQLLDWVLERAALSAPEKLWWAWYIALHGEPPALCRSLAETLLAHRALTPADKRALCQAWLDDAPAGQPPAQWEAMQAMLRGDAEAFVRYSAEAGMPVPVEKLPSAAELEADFDTALDALLDADDGVEPPLLPVAMFRRMLVGPMGIVPLTPLVYRREALFALAGLGQDHLALCQRYLDSARGELHAEAINLGVADVLAAYAQQMPLDAVRALVERGVAVTSAPTRKVFYQLGVDLLGEIFAVRAAADSAKLVRDWAAKRTASTASIATAAPRRGRKSRG